MRRVLFHITLLALMLLAPGCSMRERIRIEAVEAVERHGTAGFDLRIRVDNRSPRDLQLQRGETVLYYDGAEACRMTLVGTPTAPRRTQSRVLLRWRLRVSSPAAWYACEKRLREGDDRLISISFDARIAAGARSKNISCGIMPLSEFLPIFGLTIRDLQQYLP